MNKAEYKKLSHDIRTMCRNLAEMHTEMYGKKCTTRSELHGTILWRDSYTIDKYGNDMYKYRCYGDVEIGLIWEKRWKFI